MALSTLADEKETIVTVNNAVASLTLTFVYKKTASHLKSFFSVMIDGLQNKHESVGYGRLDDGQHQIGQANWS